jgi:IclR family pca regulon transcriptional regulator
MAAAANGTDRDYRISAVEKGFQVLDAFAERPHRFTLSEIAAATGLSTNQAFRVLQTLVAIGYVRQESEGKAYRLGPRAFALVPALYHGDELLVAGRDALDAAHSQTGEMISLIVLERGEATICVDARERGQVGVLASGIGSHSAFLHAGAAGKLLLAFLPDEAVTRYLATNQPLHRFTDQTIGAAEELRAAVRAIRRQGNAVSLGEVAEGMYGIAAPVRDRRGEVVAAVALAASLAGSRPAERDRHLAVVIEAARRISINLGYRAAVAFG